MPTYNTEMQAIIASLDQKIAALQSTKAAVQAAISNGKSVQENTATMDKINESLRITQGARVALFDDCCGASCGITWYDQ